MGPPTKDEWVSKAIENKDKESMLEAILQTRIALMQDPKYTRAEQCGDTVSGLNDIAKRCPTIFSIPAVVELLVGLLRWQPPPTREGHFQHHLAASLLMTGLGDVEQWPTVLVHVFMTDAMDKRLWVDLHQSSLLVANIVTAFPGSCAQQPVAIAPKPLQGKAVEPDPKRRKTELSPTLRAQGAPASSSQYFEEEGFSGLGGAAEGGALPPVRPRFRSEKQQQEIQGIVMEAMRQHVEVAGEVQERKAKSVLKVVPLLLGYDAVRNIVACKIESWINNPNVVRFTRELLPRLANECTLDTDIEQDTMRRVVQLKHKAHANKEQLEAIAALVRRNVHFCQLALGHYLKEETSNLDALTASKSLKQKQHCEMIFKFGGTVHLYSQRPLSHGGGRERHPVSDAGVGLVRFQVQAELRLWSVVKQDADAARRAIVIATDADLCGRAEVEGDERIAAIHTCGAALLQAGCVGLIVILSSPVKNIPKIWNAQLMLPIGFVQPGESAAGLLEAAAQRLPSWMIRTPIETELAFQLKVLADTEGSRAGLCALTRKLLKLGDLDAVALCADIMAPTPQMYGVEESQRRAFGNALVDVVCYVCIFQAAHAQEVGQAPVHAERSGGGENRMVKAMSALRTQISAIQQCAVEWAYTQLPLTIGDQALPLAVRKLVFREKPSSYSSSQDPLEAQERAAFSLLQYDIPVTFDTLRWAAMLGLPTMPMPFPMPVDDRYRLTGRIQRGDALDVVDVLIARAVSLEAKRVVRGVTDELDVPNLVVHPENSNCLEQLCLNKRYWQACLAATLLAIFNPATVGFTLWQGHPTVRCMLQMLLTGIFKFPPLSKSAAGPGGMEPDHEVIRTAQLLAAADANAIERAKLVVTQTNLSDTDKIVLSMQLDTAIVMDPGGPARQPPAEVFDQLRKWDSEHNMGFILRQSRNPDLLLETIRSYGTQSVVSWLGPILERYPATVDALPEFTIAQLLFADLTQAIAAEKRHRPETHRSTMDLSRMVERLAVPLMSTTPPSTPSFDLFADNLCSPSAVNRGAAVRALELLSCKAAGILISSDDANNNWLALLAGLPSFHILRPMLGEMLRRALTVETDAALVAGYLTHLMESVKMDPQQLAVDTSQFLLHRSIFASHLAQQPGAMHAIINILAAAVQVGFIKSPLPSEPLVTCSNGKQVPCCVARACVHVACLSSRSDTWSEEASPLLDAVMSSTKHATVLGLDESDTLAMIKCCHERVYLAGVEIASLNLLLASLGIFGPAPGCLKAVCARLKEAHAQGTLASASAVQPVGLRRAIVAVRTVDASMAEWLEAQWPTSAGRETTVSGPLVERVRAQGGDVDMGDVQQREDSKSSAGAAVLGAHVGSASALSSAAGLVEIAEKRPHELEGAIRTAATKLHGGSPSSEASLISDLNKIALEGRGTAGLCTDVLTVISPMLTRPHSRAGDNGDAVRKTFWGSPQRAVLGTLVRWGSREAADACARWLLGAVLEAQRAEMVREGVALPCALALDALACFLMGGGSVGWEGYWDEGGGSDVNETKTWREHASSCVVRKHVSPDECVALAGYVVCEAAHHGGEMRMGRMQLLLEAVGACGEVSARRVGDELISILARLCEDKTQGCAVREGMLAASWELLERLKLALPKALALLIPPPLGDILPGREGGDALMVRQTSKLDILLQLTLTSLQDPDKAPGAMVVARQIAITHPRLIATHMLSLRAICAGKSLMRLSDFIHRNGPRLLGHVISIVAAARPHSLASARLPSLLDEVLAVYSATVRYEAALEPLLGKLAELLRSYAMHSAHGMAYVRAHASSLQTLAEWYAECGELQALLDKVQPGAVLQGLGLGGESSTCRQVEQVSSRLRMRRRKGVGTQFGKPVDEDEGLLEALEDADLSTKGSSGADLLLLLERPLLDLLSAPTESVRDTAYKLVLRLAVQRPDAAPRVASKLMECLQSWEEPVRASAVRHAPEVTHLSAATAPHILRALLRIARGGSSSASEELLRATRSGLAYAILQAK